MVFLYYITITHCVALTCMLDNLDNYNSEFGAFAIAWLYACALHSFTLYFPPVFATLALNLSNL